MPGLHIFLWEGENTEKANRMGKALGAPNRYFNEFLSRVDEKNFIESLQTLLREDHTRIKITIEKSDTGTKDR